MSGFDPRDRGRRMGYLCLFGRAGAVWRSGAPLLGVVIPDWDLRTIPAPCSLPNDRLAYTERPSRFARFQGGDARAARTAHRSSAAAERAAKRQPPDGRAGRAGAAARARRSPDRTPPIPRGSRYRGGLAAAVVHPPGGCSRTGAVAGARPAADSPAPDLVPPADGRRAGSTAAAPTKSRGSALSGESQPIS